MISLSHIDLFIDKKQLLHDINLTLPKGQLIGLIGPNGAGKSTLMKLLAGVLPHQSGEYRFDDQAFETLSAQARAKNIGYLAQSLSLAWPLTVQQIVALGRLPYQTSFKKDNPSDEEAVENAMLQTETSMFKERIANTLSGGELTRVLIARVLAGDPTCIIADEPIASLDPYHQLHVIELLKGLAQQGKTVIVSLHDLNMALRFCDTLLMMEEGRIIAAGDPKTSRIPTM